jgi:hypothetical protein
MRKRLVVPAAILAGLLLAVVVHSEIVGTSSAIVGTSAGPEQPAQASIKPGALAQVYGNVCSTDAGICLVPPQPVNSTCFCGSVPGVIVP